MSSMTEGSRRYLTLLALVAGLGGAACGSGDHAPAARLDSTPGRGGSGGGGTGAVGDAGPDSSPDASAAPNCGTWTCTGIAHCDTQTSQCACEFGYMLQALPTGEYDCVVDKSCVKLHRLEDAGCRVQLGAANAVALFFAVDYCAGMAVLPADLGDITKAFRVLEDGVDIKTNPESYATIIPRSVESFVGIALDVSGSLTPALITPLIAEVKTFVSGLTAAPGAPPIMVELTIFGRDVYKAVPFTSDLASILAKLDAIEAAHRGAWANLPDASTEPTSITIDGRVVRIDGTALHTAVNRGVRSVERMRHLRTEVTDKGVLSSGTFVVITDGRDSSEPLDKAFIDSAISNVISVGVSSDINADDLAAIGRDGRFLAPTTAEWNAAFSAITQRVQEYPKRSYLLAYCSSAIDGTHSVSVDLAGYKSAAVASCDFSAELFGRGVQACTPSYLAGSCRSLACGGMLACGACADSECCTLGQCVAPGSNTINCMGQDDLCAPAREVCVYRGPATDPNSPCAAGALDATECWQCTAPVARGGQCDDRTTRCAPGVDFCDKSSTPSTCQPVLLSAYRLNPTTGRYGDSCGTAPAHSGAVCDTLNCQALNPDNTSLGYFCAPPAAMYDACGGVAAEATCEVGTACLGGICQYRDSFADPCSTGTMCTSGYCPSSAPRCTPTGFCSFNWSAKITAPPP